MKRAIRTVAGISFLFFCLVSEANAATYYVDNARPDDSGAGTSWAVAKKTIAAGVALLASGDTLTIKGGTSSANYTAYNEPILVTGKTFSSTVTITTDDGIGNPGYVQIDGTGSTPAGLVAIGTWNVDHVTIDGRVRRGFAANRTDVANIVLMGSGSDCRSNLKALNIEASGTTSSEGLISMASVNNAEIGHCDVGGSSPFLIQMSSWGTGDPSPCSGGSIHDNVIQGTTSEGYSAISLLRFDDVDVYNNYIHNVNATGGGPTLVRVRQGHDNRIYNNVIWHTGNSKSFFQARGMSTGTGAANRNWFYNNTVVNEGTAGEGFAFISDESSGNKWFNNLVIGAIQSSFVETWSPIESGSQNNELYSNVVTGSVGGWFGSGAQDSFSVTSGGASSQGTFFVNASGDRPYPFWGLNSSQDGTGGVPLVDYAGNVRSSPPDVGAFEYVGAPDTTPPGAPTGLATE